MRTTLKDFRRIETAGFLTWFFFIIFLASKKDPTNVDILMTKASIYENLKLPKKKMEVYENVLKV